MTNVALLPCRFENIRVRLGKSATFSSGLTCENYEQNCRAANIWTVQPGRFFTSIWEIIAFNSSEKKLSQSGRYSNVFIRTWRDWFTFRELCEALNLGVKFTWHLAALICLPLLSIESLRRRYNNHSSPYTESSQSPAGTPRGNEGAIFPPYTSGHWSLRASSHLQRGMGCSQQRELPGSCGLSGIGSSHRGGMGRLAGARRGSRNDCRGEIL